MAAKTSSAQFTMKPEVMAGIEEHAYSLLTAEVGGMLMGSVKAGKTTIVGFIPALSASAEQVTLTFTHDVWEEILTLAAKEFPKHSIVGWYHTHPTFGVFLSEYDLFIQENFFNADGHLALVIDPVQGAYGWFSKTAKGKVQVFEEGLTQTGPKKSIDPGISSEGASRSIVARVSLAGLVGVLVGGAVGAGATLTQIPPDLTGALESTRAELAQRSGDFALYQELTAELFQDPVLQYQVAEGDSLDGIAAMFYQTPATGRLLILAANNLEFDAGLETGVLLLIPNSDVVSISPQRPTEILPDPLPAFPGLPPYGAGATDSDAELQPETEDPVVDTGGLEEEQE
jgi:proteasome lid subunit RPN8/RPN11